VAICPPYRPNRKGVVEAANRYIAQRFWRSCAAASMSEAQARLDLFMDEVADARERAGKTVGELAAAERLLPLPAGCYPATIECVRTVDAYGRVAYQGNRYSTPPGLVGHQVLLRRRLGERELQVVSGAGLVVARHGLLAAGSGGLAELAAHRQAAQQLVFAATAGRSGPACPRKLNCPPGEAAQAAARALRGEPSGAVVVDLAQWAAAAEGARP